MIVLIDELRNSSISVKVADYYSHMTERIFSRQMVKKIRTDLYEVVRLPYFRMSDAQFLKMVTLNYAAIFAIFLSLELASYQLFLLKSDSMDHFYSLPYILGSVLGAAL
mmetsp:Transcript_41143/g.30260  ORF Transcript_41143/g.30260 Transcript_41143/m.30260 type:complete len:109 (+) Transcript_41143:192-518(+)